MRRGEARPPARTGQARFGTGRGPSVLGPGLGPGEAPRRGSGERRRDPPSVPGGFRNFHEGGTGFDPGSAAARGRCQAGSAGEDGIATRGLTDRPPLGRERWRPDPRYPGVAVSARRRRRTGPKRARPAPRWDRALLSFGRWAGGRSTAATSDWVVMPRREANRERIDPGRSPRGIPGPPTRPTRADRVRSRSPPARSRPRPESDGRFGTDGSGQGGDDPALARAD